MKRPDTRDPHMLNAAKSWSTRRHIRERHGETTLGAHVFHVKKSQMSRCLSQTLASNLGAFISWLFVPAIVFTFRPGPKTQQQLTYTGPLVQKNEKHILLLLPTAHMGLTKPAVSEYEYTPEKDQRTAAVPIGCWYRSQILNPVIG